jgi:H/ACA ribonucleoprotein complex subunit 1
MRELNDSPPQDATGILYDDFSLFQVISLGSYLYPAQDDLVVKVEIEDVPYFNAPIYLENKEQIGKIDEIFGNIRDYYESVKLSDDVKVKSFKAQQKVNIHNSFLIINDKGQRDPGRL